MCDIWQQFLTIARDEVGSRVVETWFKAISFVRFDAAVTTVYLEAPNVFVRDWVQKHYQALFQTHLGRLLHVATLRVVFQDNRLQPQETVQVQQSPVAQPPSDQLMVRAQQAPAYLDAVKKRPSSSINGLHTFESFVVGSSNSLAYAAAHAITEKPGILYNPLFIYGKSGLGKTHLLHAIGNEIKTRNKDAVVVYQTTDRFVTEFINAIRFDKVHRFKEKYRQVDILLIDDVQFISNKEQTQEAFFHIFNSLYDAHKQIVFSSDTFPQDITGIAERLQSRLASGLVADMHMPSLETKVAIIKKKAALSNEDIGDEVAYFIASLPVSNVRELEGALIRVLAFSSLTHQPITLELAQKVLARGVMYHTAKRQHVDFDRIINTVNKYYPCTLAALRSKSRNKDVALARHVVMFFMKQLTDRSLRAIGEYLGGRDHSTIMHGLEKVQEQIVGDKTFEQTIKIIERELAG
jgi:chromosomal replication initiator protein